MSKKRRGVSGLWVPALRSAGIINAAKQLARLIHDIDGDRAPDIARLPVGITGAEWMKLLRLANVISPPEES